MDWLEFGVCLIVIPTGSPDLRETVSKLTSNVSAARRVCNIQTLMGKTGNNLCKLKQTAAWERRKMRERGFFLSKSGELWRSKCSQDPSVTQGTWKIITADPSSSLCGKHGMCSSQHPSGSAWSEGMWGALHCLGCATLLQWQHPKCRSLGRTDLNICFWSAFREERGVSGYIPCFLSDSFPSHLL